MTWIIFYNLQIFILLISNKIFISNRLEAAQLHCFWTTANPYKESQLSFVRTAAARSLKSQLFRNSDFKTVPIWTIFCFLFTKVVYLARIQTHYLHAPKAENIVSYTRSNNLIANPKFLTTNIFRFKIYSFLGHRSTALRLTLHLSPKNPKLC